MKTLIRKWLMGDTIFSEYSKITIAGIVKEKVWLRIKDDYFEISVHHWLLCIEPIVFGVWIDKNKDHPTLKENEYEIYMGGSFDTHKNTIILPESTLVLELFNSIVEVNGTLLVLKLKRSSIHHTNFFKSYLLFFRYYRKDGLTFSRFKAFVTAYGYPRRIRLVSFRQNDYYNIFPMDLLGDISHAGRYVFGLRHTNVALPKIIETRKLVVCEVSSRYQPTIYQLGKHHSSIPPSLDSLPFKVIASRNFGSYVPEWADSYKEINILQAINMGSHMLLWGEAIEMTQLKNADEHLFLVHFLQFLNQKNKGASYLKI